MTVYILGAGPAGLALAQGLAEKGAGPFVLIESEAEPGGLARTVTSPGLGRHDLGPHKLYSSDSVLMKRVENLLPGDQWLTRPKHSRIYMGGHFLPYPPSPFSLLRLFGIRALAGMGWDFLRAQRRRKTPASTFEEELSQRVGQKLYQAFFKPIAEKIWGDPSQLDAQLSRDRVQLPTLSEFFRRQTGRFETLHFRYPRGGLQTLWKAMEEKIAARGRILYSHRVSRLSWSGRRVTGLIAENRTTGRETTFPLGPEDFVFSTLPLSSLRSLSPELGDAFHQRVRDATPAHDLLLVFLKIVQPQMLKASWVFVADPSLPFHRVSEQNAFDPAMTSEGSLLCCEMMSRPDRPLGNKSDQALIDLAVDGLGRMGYRFQVERGRVVRLPGSYPVMRPGAAERRDAILSELDRSENFRTLGRQGSFHYVGSLDAMDMGFGAAQWFCCRTTGADWADERRRTRRYPILD